MAARRILLGLSFFDQGVEATKTLASFAAPLASTGNDFVLGLENEKPRTEVAHVLASLQAQGWTACYIWDDEVTRFAMSLLDQASVLPFFSSFSYGAAVNRLLLLTIVSGCDYLLRVDPGVGCPPNVGDLVDRHMDAISRGKKVVSAQYDGRVALRDDFVSDTQREEYYQFVQDFTGIDCQVGRQITGGAAMTLAAQGPPAIVFDNVRVWASDDGFFQVFLGTDQTEIQRKIAVRRSEPGFGLQLSAYLARVAAMVVLRHAHEGKQSDVSLQKARHFLQDVRRFVLPCYSYDLAAADTQITPQIPAIYSGYSNYQRLVAEWPSVAQELTGSLDQGSLKLW